MNKSLKAVICTIFILGTILITTLTIYPIQHEIGHLMIYQYYCGNALPQKTCYMALAWNGQKLFGIGPCNHTITRTTGPSLEGRAYATNPCPPSIPTHEQHEIINPAMWILTTITSFALIYDKYLEWWLQ